MHPFRSSNVSFFTLQNRAWSLMHTWRATGVRPASRSLGIKHLVMWTLTWSSYCLLIQLCRRKLCLQTPHELSLTIWHRAAPTRPPSTPGAVISAPRSMWLPQQVCRRRLKLIRQAKFSSFVRNEKFLASYLTTFMQIWCEQLIYYSPWSFNHFIQNDFWVESSCLLAISSISHAIYQQEMWCIIHASLLILS